MKRQRGRGRRPGGGHQQHNNHGNPNRPMESNGPENTKVRGPAAVVYERYQQYARDASSSGDRVLSENYLQHADHYFRLMRTMQPAQPPPSERFESDSEFSDAQGDEGGRGDATTEGARDGGQDEFEGDSESPAADQGRGDGDFRRRRGRRNRFRPGAEGGDAGAADARAAEEGDERPMRADRVRPDRGDRPEPRGERTERRERAPRERDETQTQEGFSNGPRPAFLGSD
jgi:hypothetical protein